MTGVICRKKLHAVVDPSLFRLCRGHVLSIWTVRPTAATAQAGTPYGNTSPSIFIWSEVSSYNKRQAHIYVYGTTSHHLSFLAPYWNAIHSRVKRVSYIESVQFESRGPQEDNQHCPRWGIPTFCIWQAVSSIILTFSLSHWWCRRRSYFPKTDLIVDPWPWLHEALGLTEMQGLYSPTRGVEASCFRGCSDFNTKTFLKIHPTFHISKFLLHFYRGQNIPTCTDLHQVDWSWQLSTWQLFDLHYDIN